MIRLGRLLVAAGTLVRLGDLLAGVDIDHEAVGEDGLVRCLPVERHRGHQRRLEPSAVLVGRLEIEIGGELKLGTAAQNRLMADATVDPDIERVVATDRSCRRSGQAAPLGIIEGEPGIRSLLGDHFGDLLNDGGIEDRLPFGRVENGKRNPPGTLAGDAPVGT